MLPPHPMPSLLFPSATEPHTEWGMTQKMFWSFPMVLNSTQGNQKYCLRSCWKPQKASRAVHSTAWMRHSGHLPPWPSPGPPLNIISASPHLPIPLFFIYIHADMLQDWIPLFTVWCRNKKLKKVIISGKYLTTFSGAMHRKMGQFRMTSFFMDYIFF